MLRYIRHATLRLLKSSGIFEGVKNSRWRRERLLIICYHGLALEEEHEWRPPLYMHAQLFEQRLRLLRDGKYTILPLAEAIERLYGGELPPRSVAITFDDGTYDFYAQAHPRLKAYGFPATVYQTTYYCDFNYPVFHLICSYMLWKRRGQVLRAGQNAGIPEVLDLRSPSGRSEALDRLVTFAREERRSEEEKNNLAARLALVLGLDYAELLRKRVLQLMRPDEITQLAREGVDFQLHTHRHRTPLDESLFLREIRDNRRKLLEMAANPVITHFCYPSGVYHYEFLPWLKKEGVVSATTCESGLASPYDSALLLPRLVDTSSRTPLEFESWLSGVGPFTSRRRRRYKLPLPATQLVEIADSQ
jgi:peptidoglycan/xylan/chitin deacetylase (PgdA/CDA1 family)